MLDKEPELWALLDMDSSLADFDGSMVAKLQAMRAPGEPEIPFEQWYSGAPPWFEARKDAIKREPGFWRDLPVIPFGLELYHQLGKWGYLRMILTKGPRRNMAAWAEKVQWCQNHVPDADITITHDKGLVYGKVLYDDYPPYVTRWLEWRPRGKVLMLDAIHNRGFEHPQVLRVYREPLSSQLDKIQSFLGVQESTT